MDDHCNRFLDLYVSKFPDDKMDLQLSGINERYAWLYHQLVKRGFWRLAFPEELKTREAMCEVFCIKTRKVIKAFMGEEPKSKGLKYYDIAIAVDATIKFENALIGYFSNGNATEKFIGTEEASSSVNPEVDSLKIKETIEKLTDVDDNTKEKVINFNGIISSVFQPYLSMMISHRNSVMQQAFDQIVRDESWNVPNDDRTKILASSTDLMYFFSKVRPQHKFPRLSPSCLQIYDLYGKFLELYADKLAGKLISLESVENSKFIPLSTDKEKIACCILNTAQYCSHTTSTTEKLFKTEIHKKFRDKINFDPVIERFQTVITSAISILTKSTESKITPFFDELVSTDWKKVTAVNDQSQYVNKITKKLSKSSIFFNQWVITSLNPIYIFDALSQSFCSEFYSRIYKCRDVSSMGAQQLLLDVTVLRNTLSRLPIMGKPISKGLVETYRYRDDVKKKMEKIEKLLKVLLVPNEMFLDTYIQLIPTHSCLDLLKLMEIKGITKSDSDHYLELYGIKCYPSNEMGISTSKVLENQS